MSRPLLSLVEQEYRGKLLHAIQLVHRDFKNACKGVEVQFIFNGRADREKSFLVKGIVRDAHFDVEQQASYTIDFTNPETGSKETTSRHLRELRVS